MLVVLFKLAECADSIDAAIESAESLIAGFLARERAREVNPGDAPSQDVDLDTPTQDPEQSLVSQSLVTVGTASIHPTAPSAASQVALPPEYLLSPTDSLQALGNPVLDTLWVHWILIIIMQSTNLLKVACWILLITKLHKNYCKRYVTIISHTHFLNEVVLESTSNQSLIYLLTTNMVFQREKDLELAARVGQVLLQRNETLELDLSRVVEQKKTLEQQVKSRNIGGV